jgi:hypothetical protein
MTKPSYAANHPREYLHHRSPTMSKNRQPLGERRLNSNKSQGASKISRIAACHRHPSPTRKAAVSIPPPAISQSLTFPTSPSKQPNSTSTVPSQRSRTATTFANSASCALLTSISSTTFGKNPTEQQNEAIPTHTSILTFIGGANIEPGTKRQPQDSHRESNHVTAECPNTQTKWSHTSITFSTKDVNLTSFPHTDAMVITVHIDR